MAAEPAQALEVKLVDRFEVAERTMAFRLEKPEGWAFKPGQSVDLTLLNPPETDGEGNTRSFSLACDTSDPALLFATRLTGSAFKRVLSTAPLGTVLKLDGPFGNLTLHNNSSRAAVMLTGGIGITAFRGTILRAARERLQHRIVLLYSNRRPEDAAFLDELRGLEARNPNYKLVATMTEPKASKSPWSGETGLIDQAMLQRATTGLNSPIYYSAGPPGMVKAMQSLLHDNGVDDDDIRVEEFSGY